MYSIYKVYIEKEPEIDIKTKYFVIALQHLQSE